MSKPTSGLFIGTKGSRGARIIPGEEGIITGGNSTILGKNLLKSMGVSIKKRWTSYQAQHIIPAEMSDHPVLKKIGIDLDHFSNGMFLRSPADNVSTLSRHRGFHAPYNEFVRHMLNRMDISAPTYILQKEVRLLQENLRKMQMAGVVIYPKDGATFDTISRSYNRIANKKGR